VPLIDRPDAVALAAENLVLRAEVDRLRRELAEARGGELPQVTIAHPLEAWPATPMARGLW
jgi:hypothetical protein